MHDNEEIERYVKAAKESGIGPNFIHAAYLINLGAADPEHLQKSIDWLVYAMNLAANLGSRGVILHSGSHKGAGFEAVLPQIADSLQKVLRQTDHKPSTPNQPPFLILETAAGAGGSIGRSFSELGQILKTVNDQRLRICLDSAHVFAAGYELRTLPGVESMLEEFEQEIGLNNLVAIHANDSRVDFKSGRDRHENIGEGFIGRTGFANLINHPKLKELPFILEVPGFSGSGPDQNNIQLLKSLIR